MAWYWRTYCLCIQMVFENKTQNVPPKHLIHIALHKGPNFCGSPQTVGAMTTISVVPRAACVHSCYNIAYDSSALYDILT